MNNQYTAILKQEGEWWIGWIEEIPGVNCQEGTRNELIETLQITLREALEINKQYAINSAGSNYERALVTVCSETPCFSI